MVAPNVAVLCDRVDKCHTTAMAATAIVSARYMVRTTAGVAIMPGPDKCHATAMAAMAIVIARKMSTTVSSDIAGSN